MKKPDKALLNGLPALNGWAPFLSSRELAESARSVETRLAARDPFKHPRDTQWVPDTKIHDAALRLFI